MKYADFFENKVVLVTGGVGSIGSEIVKKLVRLSPKAVIVYDNNETGLFDLQQELKSDRVKLIVGDIRDRDRLVTAFTGVDIVFHAAALKHVPLCEYNPYEAVKTNIVGTQNVLDAAILDKVSKVIIISTDKAVNPINTMGASKYLAERLTIAANNNPQNNGTVFSVVRFGNVLNSRGSIIPIFMNQLQNDLPLTITDEKMTRFVMTIPEAAELVMNACAIATGKEIYILKMPALKIIDLAEVMLDKLAAKYSYNREKNHIQNIGIRIGEKLYEELLTLQESAYAFEDEDMFIVYPPDVVSDNAVIKQKLPAGFTKCRIADYSSKNAVQLSLKEIGEYVEKIFKE